jgi:hypothetical protein
MQPSGQESFSHSIAFWTSVSIGLLISRWCQGRPCFLANSMVFLEPQSASHGSSQGWRRNPRHWLRFWEIFGRGVLLHALVGQGESSNLRLPPLGNPSAIGESIHRQASRAPWSTPVWPPLTKRAIFPTFMAEGSFALLPSGRQATWFLLESVLRKSKLLPMAERPPAILMPAQSDEEASLAYLRPTRTSSRESSGTRRSIRRPPRSGNVRKWSVPCL